ncbi:MAG: DMT family transporter [Proteobacteria bacterium]|nr:DMT family transporter [Pseudomonadota bacterium]
MSTTMRAASARPLDARAATIVVILCASWGLNQVAIKIAIAEIPPLTQAAIRSIGALAIIALWARLRGIALFARDGTLRAGLLAGVLFGLEFVFIYRGIVWTTASRAVVFLYTTPFFVALGARWLGERLTALQWGGLALSFAGVAVAIGVPQPAVDLRVIAGDAMLIVAGAIWALTTLVIKGSRLATISPEKSMAYQLAVSIPILAVGALLLGESFTAPPSTAALAWLAYQTIWVVGLTYAVWFAMIRHYSASRLSSFTFLTPLFGVAAGHIILGDVISWPFAAAAALVVAGLVLVNRPR